MQSDSRFSVFDYTITITRKHRYLVVSSPEFGVQVASQIVGLGTTSPDEIGRSVIKVMDAIQQRLSLLEHEGKPHPEPLQNRLISRLKRRDLVACKQAAQALGVSRATLRRMVYSGLVRAERTPGGHLRFTLDALSDYLRALPTAKGAA